MVWAGEWICHAHPSGQTQVARSPAWGAALLLLAFAICQVDVFNQAHAFVYQERQQEELGTFKLGCLTNDGFLRYDQLCHTRVCCVFPRDRALVRNQFDQLI